MRIFTWTGMERFPELVSRELADFFYNFCCKEIVKNFDGCLSMFKTHHYGLLLTHFRFAKVSVKKHPKLSIREN